jgi:hypothetical protein
MTRPSCEFSKSFNQFNFCGTRPLQPVAFKYDETPIFGPEGPLVTVSQPVMLELRTHVSRIRAGCRRFVTKMSLAVNIERGHPLCLCRNKFVGTKNHS